MREISRGETSREIEPMRRREREKIRKRRSSRAGSFAHRSSPAHVANHAEGRKESRCTNLSITRGKGKVRGSPYQVPLTSIGFSQNGEFGKKEDYRTG